MTANGTHKSATKLQREVEVYIAPNAEGDILTMPPRVVRLPDGTLQLQVLNPEGEAGEYVYPVRRFQELYEQGLVLVGTEGKAWLMQVEDFKAHLPHPTPEELHLDDLGDQAEATVVGLSNLVDFDDQPPPARTLLEVANQVYGRNASHDEPTNAPRRRLGYVLMLDALIAAPAAVQAALQDLRDELVAADPALAIVGSVAAMPCLTPAPLAVYHRINNSTFNLSPDGTFTIERSEHPLIRLDPDTTFDVAMFFRMPGVMPLIERAESERQTASELDFQEAQREEAELIASGYYDRKRGNTPPA